MVCTFACAVIEGKEDPRNEASPGIAAMTIDSNVAEGSPLCCAGHLICWYPSSITMPATLVELGTRLTANSLGISSSVVFVLKDHLS